MKRSRLTRKVSLRDSWRKKLKRDGVRFVWKRNGVLKRKKPLKKRGRALRNRLRVYFEVSTAFLLRLENRLCLICVVRREHGENITVNVATETHHHRGRIGRLLCWVPGFRPSCYRCRLWPHDNPEKAREWGLLAPAAQYNVFPGDG